MYLNSNFVITKEKLERHVEDKLGGGGQAGMERADTKRKVAISASWSHNERDIALSDNFRWPY
jgi:hypothetical protein